MCTSLKIRSLRSLQGHLISLFLRFKSREIFFPLFSQSIRKLTSQAATKIMIVLVEKRNDFFGCKKYRLFWLKKSNDFLVEALEMFLSFYFIIRLFHFEVRKTRTKMRNGWMHQSSETA